MADEQKAQKKATAKKATDGPSSADIRDAKQDQASPPDPAPATTSDDDETRTREELYERAQELDIEGRSDMTKDELANAVASAEGEVTAAESGRAQTRAGDATVAAESGPPPSRPVDEKTDRKETGAPSRESETKQPKHRFLTEGRYDADEADLSRYEGDGPMVAIEEDVYESFVYPGSDVVGYRKVFHRGQVVPRQRFVEVAGDE